MRVERSQSLRSPGRLTPSGSGTDSPSLRPKVSFNRAVHVKRISRRLADVAEDEDSPRQAGTRAPNKMPPAANGFSTLPRSRGGVTTTPSGTLRNGVRKPPTPLPSSFVRHDPRAEDDVIRLPLPQTNPNVNQKKKKSLADRVRGIFTTKKSVAGGQKSDSEDELKARYTEFKGRTSDDSTHNGEEGRYAGKRRGSAPETRSAWFRSVDRLRKPDSRTWYSGEADRGTVGGRRRPLVESSGDSATEQEGMSRAPSLVYLHTPAVGDIPGGRGTPSRRLSRSVSVLAPWAPRLRPSRSPQPPPRTAGARSSKATQTEVPPSQARPLPKLIFTGPSIEETVGRSRIHPMRSRK